MSTNALNSLKNISQLTREIGRLLNIYDENEQIKISLWLSSGNVNLNQCAARLASQYRH